MNCSYEKDIRENLNVFFLLIKGGRAMFLPGIILFLAFCWICGLIKGE